MKDILGNTVEVGQKCAYPKSGRGLQQLNLGTVLSITEDSPWIGVGTAVIKAKSSGREIERNTLELVVVCSTK